jgi:osmoprotectant transport system substrate-binding protein
MSRSISSAAAALGTALVLVAGCTTDANRTKPAREPTPSATGTALTVAAFNFSESQLLANLFVGVLDHSGIPATVRTMTTREAVQPALWSGQVQVVPEYTSTLTSYLNTYDNGPNAAKRSSNDLSATMAALRVEASRHHLVVLNASRAASENAFAVTKEFARANKLVTLSDLARYRGALVLGGPAECPTRPYCKPGLELTYGIHFTGFRPLDPGGPLTKLALKAGLIHVGLVFSSDPGVDAYGLTVLSDDKRLQDADVVVPIVHEHAVTPGLSRALNGLMAVLTTNDLTRLNAAVDLQHLDPAAVAQDYLKNKGLM